MTADDPSALGTNGTTANASAANASAPNTTRPSSSSGASGAETSSSVEPTPTTIADSIASTSAIEPASAPRYTAGGSGVPRTRLRMPVSRRITSVIAMPANVVKTIAVPIRPGTKKSAYGTPSTLECLPESAEREQPDRQHEREERGLAVAPEESLLPDHLARREARGHDTISSVSAVSSR